MESILDQGSPPADSGGDVGYLLDTSARVIPVLEELSRVAPRSEVSASARRQAARFRAFIDAVDSKDMDAVERALQELGDAKRDGAVLADEARRCGFELPG